MAAKREIEGVGEELLAAGKPSRWERFRLPVELVGKSFLDVGCWEGVHCAEAVRRDAREVVGVDLATSADLAANVERYGFEFLEMDVFSDRWLALPHFDVVLCSGLLYCVDDPISLLARLRAKTNELLVLETGIALYEAERPIMVLQGEGEGTGNPADRWMPNKLCLERMLTMAGFAGIATVWEEERHAGYARACVHAVPTGWPERDRLLPRRAGMMSIHGGTRGASRREA